jgi:hypothetical protein
MEFETLIPELAERLRAELTEARPTMDVEWPEWFDRAGDLVVVDGEVSWATPELLQMGGFSHDVPPGKYPVYAGTWRFDGRDPHDVQYRVGMLVVPLAEPERIAGADWDGGYDDAMDLAQYGCLWDRRAIGATAPHWEYEETGKSAFIRNVEDTILPAGALRTRGNWFNGVADPETGANVLAFPVEGTLVDGYEMRDAAGELVCLIFLSYG